MSGFDVPNFVSRSVARDIRGESERGAGDFVLGSTAAMGKGIVDNVLGLGRGLYWLGTFGGDTSFMPQSVYDLMPEQQATTLSSRIASAGYTATATEGLGYLIPYLSSFGATGAAGAAGKAGSVAQGARAATVTEAAIGKVVGKTVGDAIGKVGSKIAAPATLPGKAIAAFSYPGKLIGNKIAKLPGVRQWNLLARNTPGLAAGASGFGWDSLIRADGAGPEDRLGAALHGMFAGATLHALSGAANALEASMLSRTFQKLGTNPAGTDLKAMSETIAKMRAGQPVSWNMVKQQLGPRAASTLVESLGWAALDERFTDAIFSQDYAQATEVWALTVPGALMARSGRVDYWKEWRKTGMEISGEPGPTRVNAERMSGDVPPNDMNLRRDVVAMRMRAAGADPYEGGYTPVRKELPFEPYQLPAPKDPKLLTYPKPPNFTMVGPETKELPRTAESIGEPADVGELQMADELVSITAADNKAAQEALQAEQQRDTSKYKPGGLKRHQSKLQRLQEAADSAAADEAAARDALAKLQQQGQVQRAPADMPEAPRDLTAEEAAQRGKMTVQEQQRGQRGGARVTAARMQYPPYGTKGQERVFPEPNAGGPHPLTVQYNIPDLSDPFRAALAAHLQRRFAGTGPSYMPGGGIDYGMLPSQPSRPPEQPKQLTYEQPKQIPEDVMGARKGGTIAVRGEVPQPEITPEQREYEGKRLAQDSPQARASRTVGNTRRMRENMPDPAGQGTPKRPRPDPNDQVALYGDPLVAVGFELSNNWEVGKPIIDLEWPGTPGHFRMVAPGLMNVMRVEVPASWFNAVRGTEIDTPVVVMEDPAVIRDFVRDLAAAASMRKLAGVVHGFGPEYQRGGAFATGDGGVKQVSIDGKVYQQMLPFTEPKVEDGTALPRQDLALLPEKDYGIYREFVEEIVSFAKAVRAVAPPSPGVDQIEAAAVGVVKGLHSEPSGIGDELYDAFVDLSDVTDGDFGELSRLLTPADIELIGEVFGEIGSGNLSGFAMSERLNELSLSQLPGQPAKDTHRYIQPSGLSKLSVGEVVKAEPDRYYRGVSEIADVGQGELRHVQQGQFYFDFVMLEYGNVKGKYDLQNESLAQGADVQKPGAYRANMKDDAVTRIFVDVDYFGPDSPSVLDEVAKFRERFPRADIEFVKIGEALDKPPEGATENDLVVAEDEDVLRAYGEEGYLRALELSGDTGRDIREALRSEKPAPSEKPKAQEQKLGGQTEEEALQVKAKNLELYAQRTKESPRKVAQGLAITKEPKLGKRSVQETERYFADLTRKIAEAEKAEAAAELTKDRKKIAEAGKKLDELLDEYRRSASNPEILGRIGAREIVGGTKTPQELGISAKTPEVLDVLTEFLDASVHRDDGKSPVGKGALAEQEAIRTGDLLRVYEDLMLRELTVGPLQENPLATGFQGRSKKDPIIDRLEKLMTMGMKYPGMSKKVSEAIKEQVDVEFLDDPRLRTSMEYGVDFRNKQLQAVRQDKADRRVQLMTERYVEDALREAAEMFKKNPDLVEQRVNELRNILHRSVGGAQIGTAKRRIAIYLGRPELGTPSSEAKGPLRSEVREFWRRDRDQWLLEQKDPNPNYDWKKQVKRPDEGGFIDLGAGVPVKQLIRDVKRLFEMADIEKIRTLAGVAATRSKEFVEQWVYVRNEIIRKAIPDSMFPNMLAEAHARRRRHRGEMGHLIQPALDVTKDKAWREQMVQLQPQTESGALVSVGDAPSGDAYERMLRDIPGLEKVEFARWNLIGDGDIAPASPADQAFYDASQAMLGYAYNKNRAMGGWIGNGSNARMLGATDKHIYPRVLGPDYATVIGNDKLRNALFQVAERYNSNITAAALEKAYKGKPALNTDTIDATTAMERERLIDVLPHTMTVDGITYEILRSDVQSVIANTQRLQSAMLGTHEIFGQDGTAETRKAVRERALKIVGRGTAAALEQAQKGVTEARQKLVEAQAAARKAENQVSVERSRLDKMEDMLKRATGPMDADARKASDQAIEKQRNQLTKSMKAAVRASAAMGKAGRAVERAEREVILSEEAQGLEEQASQVLRFLQKPGLSGNDGHLAMAIKELEASQVAPTRKVMTGELMKEAVTLVQGRGLDQDVSFGPILRAVRAVDSVPRAIMTQFAPVYDVAEYVALPMLYGTKGQNLKLVKEVYGDIKNMRVMDAMREQVRLGVVSSQLNMLLYEQTTGLGGKVSGFLGKPGELTERGKAYIIAKLADIQLQDFRNGNITAADQSRFDTLRLPADLQMRLTSGKFSETDANRYRIDLVRHATRRAEPGEGVPTSDRLAVQAIIRFGRLMGEHMSRTVQKVADFKNAKPEMKMRKLGELGAWSLGMYGVSVVGFDILAVYLHGILRGDDFETMNRRVMDNLTSLRGGLEAADRALFGGSADALRGTFFAPRREDQLRATAIGDYVATANQLYHSIIRDGLDWGDVVEAMRELHLMPLEADVVNRGGPRMFEHVVAAMSGQALSLRSDHIKHRDLVYDYLRRYGGKRGLLGLPTERDEFKLKKDREFYDIVNEGLKTWLREAAIYAGDGVAIPSEVWTNSFEQWKKAAQMDDSSPASVAGWIRSRKASSLLQRSGGTVAELIDYAGEKAVEDLLNHDNMLETLAGYVQRMERGLPEQWSEEVDEFRKLAVTGSSEVKKIVQDAVEHATQSVRFDDEGNLLNENPDFGWIRDLAPVIARHERIWKQVFTGRQGLVWDYTDSPTLRQEYARDMLSKRAVERAKFRAKRGITDREMRYAEQFGK